MWTMIGPSLIGVMLGGILGFAGTYYTHRLQLQRETREIKLSKLGELVEIALAIRDIHQDSANYKNLLNMRTQLLQRLAVNVRVYNSELKSKANAVEKTLDAMVFDAQTMENNLSATSNHIKQLYSAVEELIQSVEAVSPCRK